MKIKVIVVFLLEVCSYNLNKLKVKKENKSEKTSKGELVETGKL